MYRSKFNGADIIPHVATTGVYGEPLGKEPNKAGYTLVAGTTYYYYLGNQSKEAAFQSVHLKWDAAAVLTITIEDSNLDDVLSYSVTAGEWIKEDPSTAYVGGSGGVTVTNATVAVAGGTAGGCMFHLGLMGSLRTRVKVVVGGTGGVVRVAACHKE